MRDNKNEILAELIPEMERIDSEWLAYTKSIILNTFQTLIYINTNQNTKSDAKKRIVKRVFLILTC